MPKPLVITDDTVVNSYGFRVLTDGGDISLYLNNPVLLYDHARRNYENNKGIILPIGKGLNLTRKGSQYIVTPEFDLEDEFAAEIARKYEKDIINMASIGIDPLEWSEDPELMLPGQKYPTITKWILKEVSITDIGANHNCHKLLHNGTMLMLSDKTRPEDIENFFNTPNKNQSNMKKTIAALNATGLVTLADVATDDLAASGVQAIAGALKQKDDEIIRLQGEVTSWKQKAEDGKLTALKDKATIMVNANKDAGKITAEQVPAYISLASASEDAYENTRKILEATKAYEPVIPKLELGDKTEVDLIAMWDKAYKDSTGREMKTLKANAALYKEVYKAKFGKEPKA